MIWIWKVWSVQMPERMHRQVHNLHSACAANASGMLAKPAVAPSVLGCSCNSQPLHKCAWQTASLGTHSKHARKTPVPAASKGSKGGQGKSSNPFSSGGQSKRNSPDAGAKGGKGGSSSGKGAAQKGQPGSSKGGKVVAVQQPQESHVSGPIDVELQDEMSRTEFTEEPRWDTWCNHLGGEWVGHYAAYTPWAATPEPVWMDSKGKYLSSVFTRSLEYRGLPPDSSSTSSGSSTNGSSQPGATAPAGAGAGGAAAASGDKALASSSAPAEDDDDEEEGDRDVFVRRLVRAPTLEALKKTSLDVGSPAGEDEEVEGLLHNAEGCVIFTGGHYSAGPDYIGPPQFKLLQDDDDDNASTPGASEQEARASTGASQTDSTSGSNAGAQPQGNKSKGFGPPRPSLPSGGDEQGEEGEGDQTSVEAPTTTSIFESCLVDWASRSRSRLKITARIGHHPETGEVDVQILRIVLFREYWAGPTAATREEAAAALQRTVARHLDPSAGSEGVVGCPTQAPRPSRDALHGSWAVFTVGATSVEETDPLTGKPTIAWVYTTNEDRQLWAVPRGPPSAEDDTGGALWLPGGIVASFRMVNFSHLGQEEEEEEGSGSDGEEGSQQQHANKGSSQEAGGSLSGQGAGASPRGLRLGMSWVLPGGGQVAVVERDYDGAGVLRGVRYSTAVKGGWAGGQM